MTQPDQLGLITIATTANGPVLLKDVGTVVDGFKTVNAINRVDGIPAVTISLTKLGRHAVAAPVKTNGVAHPTPHPVAPKR